MSNSIILEMKNLNFLILKQLTASTTKSPLIRDKFEPSFNLINILVKKYNLINKFVDGQQILKIFHSLQKDLLINLIFVQFKKIHFKLN